MGERTRVAVAAVVVGAAIAAGADAAPPPKPPDLAVKVMPSAEAVYVGRGLVYSVIVSNRGGAEADGIVAEIAFGGDADAGEVDVSGDGATCSLAQPARVSCALDLLNRGESTRIRLHVRPQSTGTIELSTTATAPADSDTSNNTATATTPVRPGKPGPPELSGSRRPELRTSKPPGPAAVVVSGRVDVSEPSAVAISLVDRTLGRTLVLSPGSLVTGAKLTTKRAVLRSSVGDAKRGGSTSIEYALRLPAAKLQVGHVYAVIVDAIDLENEQAKQLLLAFRMKKM